MLMFTSHLSITRTPRRRPGRSRSCARPALPPASRRRARASIQDDPIAREPESQDASKARALRAVAMYELTYNLFVTSGYKPTRRAREEHQHDRRGAGLELVHQPDRHHDRHRRRARARARIVGAPPDPSKWVLIREKTSGAHPGFTATDAKGETWFLEFDPPHVPEGATGAVAIATKIFWALGYNQVEIVPDHVRSEARRDRPEGDGPSPVGKRTPVHAGRHERDPRERRAQCRTAPIASSPAA